MKKSFLSLLTAGLLAAFGSASMAAGAIDIDSMSLEKTNPFETPAPAAFELNSGLIRPTEVGFPSMIPHDIENFRVGKDANACLMCHGNTSAIDQPKVKNLPTAMPSTHWVRNEKKKIVMHGRRLQCDICHAPQANVPPLVETLY